MEQSAEQNKTEEPTPFKLKRARERGVVARGIDLGFFSVLSALAIFALIGGDAAMSALQQAIHHTLASQAALAQDPQAAVAAASALYRPGVFALAGLAATAFALVVLFEIVQVRGIVFSAKPLQPDFGRLNPAKGLKRLFSTRMLKETAKNIVKLAAYGIAAYLAVKHGFDAYARATEGAPALAEAMRAGALRLLFLFIPIALGVAVLDQVLARKEFAKQMRMSRSELTREHKEREGEPRLKQKRKQLHAELSSQTRSLGALKGSDLLVVNPQHFAVGLKYDSSRMQAPRVTAKGRNHFALQLKRRAGVLAIAVIEHPQLARALFRDCSSGDEIPPQHYRAVADVYLKYMSARARKDADARLPH